MKISLIARVLLAVVLLAFAACGKPSDKLIGKWGVDTAKLGQMEEFKSLPEEAKKMAEGMIGGMTFEFTKDKLIVEMMGKKEEGAYKVKSEEGNKVVLEGTIRDKTETIEAVFEGDTLILGKGKDKFPLKRK